MDAILCQLEALAATAPEYVEPSRRERVTVRDGRYSLTLDYQLDKIRGAICRITAARTYRRYVHPVRRRPFVCIGGPFSLSKVWLTDEGDVRTAVLRVGTYRGQYVRADGERVRWRDL